MTNIYRCIIKNNKRHVSNYDKKTAHILSRAFVYTSSEKFLEYYLPLRKYYLECVYCIVYSVYIVGRGTMYIYDRKQISKICANNTIRIYGWQTQSFNQFVMVGIRGKKQSQLFRRK